MRVQHVVRGGTWQGARLAAGGERALLGTTMSPGFSYEDYERGTAELKVAYPGFEESIEARPPGRERS